MRCAWSPSSSLVGHQANTHDSPPQHWEEPHPESRSAADNQDSPYDNPAWERATSTTVQVTSRWLNRGVPMLAPPEASSVGVRVSVPLDNPSRSEERRVGKECRYRGWQESYKIKNNKT